VSFYSTANHSFVPPFDPGIVFRLTPTRVSAGYVFRNNKVLTLQFPGSSYTQALGINESDEVVGYFLDSGSHVHGFAWTPPADAAKK
jgi:hypothetical protein